MHNSQSLGIFNNLFKRASHVFLPRISMQMDFSSYLLYLFDLRPFLVILPNLTYVGHDGSYYFNDYKITKHHPMIKQSVPLCTRTAWRALYGPMGWKGLRSCVLHFNNLHLLR